MVRKRHQRILALLAVFAMLFCNINLSSFAEENTEAEENQIRTICGLEEHTHTDECYEKTPICGQAESGKKTEKRFNAFRAHEHSDSCYDENGNLNCGIIEGKYYHAHNEYCYDDAGNLVCGLEEVWPHEHTDTCYETEKKLVCGKEEAEGHKHTDACYKQSRELICEKAEDPGHHHSDACYTEHTTLTCGKQEDPGHHHSDACYTEHTNLTCGKQEDPGHHHSDACYTEHTTLTCEKQEDPGHHHSDACYTEHTTLTCEKQEDPGHHHSDECYRDQQVLTCEQEGNEDHTHTEECYTTLRELICEEPERDGHTHGESCYTTTRDLTCGETERDGHTHGDACYTTLRELTCGETERDGHAHSDACYTTTRELTCQEPERDGHTHSETCYTTTRDLTCQEKERDGHTHTDDCYRVWNELVCEKEEKEGHTHSESCYETQRNLICKELSTTHHHTAACRDEEGRLICGEIEVQEFVSTADRWTEEVISEGHRHTDDCYEQTLICEKEEHTHTDACYPAPEETEEPEAEPTEEPTETPEGEPTEEPTETPEGEPTEEPTETPEGEPAEEPTETPEGEPAEEPTETSEAEPTEEPTETPEAEPTEEPTETPEGEPAEEPTETPEAEPTEEPEEGPTGEPGGESEGETTEEPEELTISTTEEAPFAAAITFTAGAGIPEGTELVVIEAGEESQPENADELLLYRKILELSLVSGGTAIEPDSDAELSVTVSLPGIEYGQTVEVRRITENGSELLDSTNDGGTVTFTTNVLTRFEFVSRALELSAWSTERTENTFYGKTAGCEARAEVVSVADTAEGLEVLEAFRITQNSGLRLAIRYADETEPGEPESIALYTMEDGKLGRLIRENIRLSDMIWINTDEIPCYALVKDSGLRHLTLGTDRVVLDGMMPMNADLSAVNVSGVYTDFRTDEKTIAAYDISILNGDGEYHPEGSPVSVTIRDEGIAQAQAEGKTLFLHIVRDDGTEEEITDFTVEGDTVAFSTEELSVYVVTETVEKSLSAGDSTYRITVFYDKTAGIPDGSEIAVREADAAAYLPGTMNVLNWTEQDVIFYQRYLQIDLLYNGEKVIPEKPADVRIVLADVEDGAKTLQVVRFGENGAEEITAGTSEDAVVTFSTQSFGSVFGFANIIRPVLAETYEMADITVLSFDEEAEPAIQKTKVNEPEEGLELLSAFSVDEGTEDSVWLQASLREGAEPGEEESILLYSVNNQTIEEPIMEAVTEDGQICPVTQDAEGYALVKDTGYRHLTLELTPETGEENRQAEGTAASGNIIILDGMMPKAAEAAATDVTADYSEFAGTEEPETGSTDQTADAENAAEGDLEEAVPARTTLVAYDISISNGEADYQPDESKPISVEIRDDRITAGGNIELWHILDDGTREQVTEFTAGEGWIAFEATGFSVYMVIDHEDQTVVSPRVEFHFISKSDGNSLSTGSTAYYKTPRYIFRNRKPEYQFSQILSNGESLELIVDPGNISGEGELSDQFFYGWYIVDPVEISGASDKYGVGISDTNLYYSWPVHPEAISFEKPITINETNVQIGDTINWSLNGVSGSGEVDKDGILHVLLAPVYEKYNFVNFMLYAREENEDPGHQLAAKNLMTRKLIAMGSAASVEVKISDVRSNSKDSTHLIFTGWEYKDGDTWVQKQTVDYFGAELMDEGRDGVYLTNLSLQDEESIDLYPIFVEARWVDFVSGVSGVGASFIGSRFLQAWGRALDENDNSIPRTPDENVFETLPVPTRPGYDFAGWYTFATTNPDTGEITNLPEDHNPQPMDINYVDTTNQDNYVTRPVHMDSMEAIQITDGTGAVTYRGTYSLSTESDTKKLFGTDENGRLMFYEALDRLKLYARWTPSDTKITVIYWTENAEDDNYTASAARTVTTGQLTAGLGRNITSGSTISLDDLVNCPDGEYGVGIAKNEILDDVGAVPKKEDPTALTAREEIFFELNENLSDASKVIDGQGETIFNVYFNRIVFTLVFHVGRDGHAKNYGQQSAQNDNWIEYMYRDDEMPIPGRSSAGASYTGRTADEFKMINTVTGREYTSAYRTTPENIKKDYVPKKNPDPTDNDYNLYTITAKYGAYIGDQWPSHANPAWQFPAGTTTTSIDISGDQRTLYIWTAYYDSLYFAIAKARPTTNPDGSSNSNGRNADINGIFRYMSGELCASQDGNSVINDAHVHHLVAYFGRAKNDKRFKQYHTMFESVPGGWMPDGIELVPGTDFVADDQYSFTTWTMHNTSMDKAEIIGHYFYEMDHDLPEENLKKSPVQVISNVDPVYQLATGIDGYEMVYSCYEKNTRPNPEVSGQNDYHIYFFYRPKQYTLTLKFEDEPKTQQFFYKETLSDALDYEGYTEPSKEGYQFLGWYTNDAGEGEPFDFANSRMPSEGVVLYPIFKKLDYIVRIDPNGGEIDAREGGGASTGFRADYNETISAYNFLERNYLQIDDEEAQNLDSSQVYYYMNTQYISEEHDGRFVPSKLRNTLYLTAAQIDAYWDNWYNNTEQFPDLAFSSRGATRFTDKNDWMDAYFGGHNLENLPKYRAMNENEHYSFMGWFQVFGDGSVASTPFDFNTKVKEDITIRALWRLDGGYYLVYKTVFYPDPVNDPEFHIYGKIDQWLDPEHPTEQLYADQSRTHILRGPTDIKPEEWVFRGWRIVRKDITDGVETWVPIQFDEHGNPIYYQPGESFTVEAQYATEIPEAGSAAGAIIYMQAFYEREGSTSRRPLVTNLTLDANSTYGNGYIDGTPETVLPSLERPGSSAIVQGDGESKPTRIEFGDLQSNLALHLYRYATNKTFNEDTGLDLFKSEEDLYTLIGFDPNPDPMTPSTGKAFVPAYSPDSVIAVTRDENLTLYAMWEPKIYVTFVNDTDAPLEVQLSGDGTDMIRVVNTVTGEYDREESSSIFTIPANDQIKIVLPKATAGASELTAIARNTHYQKKITVTGEYQGASYGNGEENVAYGYDVIYDECALQLNMEGVVVTYTEKDDLQIDYDVNGGVWTETLLAYKHVGGDQYLLDSEDIVNGQYRPSSPTREGKVCIGWTTNKDIKDHDDFTGTDAVSWGETFLIPTGGENLLDIVKRDYLWDFSRDPSEVYDKTLYAVWTDAVKVTFNVVRTGNKIHTWTDPDTVTTYEPFKYYQTSDPKEITYTLVKGERVPRPQDPTVTEDGWYFLAWLKNNSSYTNTATISNYNPVMNAAYDFSQGVSEDLTLYTSWTASQPKYYIFTVENKVNGKNTDFDYTIAITDAKRNKSNSPRDPVTWGSVTTSLKNGERYTVTVKITFIPKKWNDEGAYSVGIEVTDKNGDIIKSGQVLTYSGNDSQDFTTDYRYTLTITQETKDEYETSAAATVINGVVEEYPEGAPAILGNTYSFTSREWSTNNDKCKAAFLPEVNNYATGENVNSVEIIFTNTGEVILPAPTNYSSHHTPYFLLMIFGVGVMSFIGSMKLVRRKKSTDEDDDPTEPTDPPRVKTSPLAMDTENSINSLNSEARSGTPAIPVSVTGTENHIRWRNSVWVDERRGTPACPRTVLNRTQPSSRQAAAPPVFPRVNLWMQPKEPPGKRGGPSG